MDMSSRTCKGQTLCSKLARSEMLCGLLDQLDSWVIRTVITPPKDLHNLMKEASLPPPDAQRAQEWSSTTQQNHSSIQSAHNNKKAAPPELSREENYFAKLEEQINLEEHANRNRLKTGDFIKTPLSTWKSRLAFAVTAINCSPSTEIWIFTPSEPVIQTLHHQLCLDMNSNCKVCPEYKHQQSCSSIFAECLAKLNIHK